MLWAQNPIAISRNSVPEPDIALLRPRADRYGSALVRPDDVYLVIEVADTSYRRDRVVKLPLYARAGIRDAWIIDLQQDVVEVFREPARRDYASVSRIERGGIVAPLALPDAVLAVDAALLIQSPTH